MSDTGTRQRFFSRMARNPYSHERINSSEETAIATEAESGQNEKHGGVDEDSDSTSPSAQLKATQALLKVDQLEQTQHRHNTDIQRFRRQDEMDRKVKRRWYPWVLFAIAVNFFLWISMIYAIVDAEYYGQNRQYFLIYAWAIVILPCIVVLFFVFSPFPRSMKAGRDRFSETVASPQAKNFINILNAAACFIAAALYLFESAIPRYNQIGWSMSVDYQNELPIPAVAVLFTGASTLLVAEDNVGDGWLWDTGLDNWIPYASSGVTINDTVYGPRTLLVWNSTALSQPNIKDPTNDWLWLQTNVTYNSTGNREDYGGTWVGEPEAYIVAFDSRLSVNEMLDCGFQPWAFINAFSVSTYTIDVQHITDTLNTVQAPNGSDSYCSQVFPDKLGQTDPPFGLYSMSLTASTPSVANYTTDCEILTNANARCRLQININYGSQFIMTRFTQHGMTKSDIWLGIGSIVGAVQFVAWFVLQIVGG